jgi:hypothetical protein
MTYHQDYLDFNRAELDDGKLTFARSGENTADSERPAAVAL